MLACLRDDLAVTGSGRVVRAEVEALAALLGNSR
jgi:hypothetical protein